MKNRHDSEEYIDEFKDATQDTKKARKLGRSAYDQYKKLKGNDDENSNENDKQDTPSDNLEDNQSSPQIAQNDEDKTPATSTGDSGGGSKNNDNSGKSTKDNKAPESKKDPIAKKASEDSKKEGDKKDEDNNDDKKSKEGKGSKKPNLLKGGAQYLLNVLSGDAKDGIADVMSKMFLAVIVIFLPFIIVFSVMAYLFAMFSNLLGNDSSKENITVAETSMIYKMAQMKDMNFDAQDFIGTNKDATYIVTYDSSIKSKLYSSEDPEIDRSDTSEAMQKSPNFEKPIYAYKKPAKTKENRGLLLDPDSTVQGYDGKNNFTGSFLKIVVQMEGTEEDLKKEGFTISDKSFYRKNSSEDYTEQDKTEVILYVPKEHVFYNETQDKNFEFTIEDEYQIMGTALQILIRDKYMAEREKVVNHIMSYANDKKYNDFNLQNVDDIETSEKDPLVIVERKKINGKYKIHKDSKIDPYGNEFDAERSMANLSDYGSNGDLINQDIAEILASYAVSKQEEAPSEGYFKELDQTFTRFIGNQFVGSVGSIKSEKYETNFNDGSPILDESGKPIRLKRKMEFYYQDEKKVNISNERVIGMLIDLDKTLEPYFKKKGMSRAEINNFYANTRMPGIRYDLHLDTKIYKEGERYTHEEFNSHPSDINVLERNNRSGKLLIPNKESLEQFMQDYELEEVYSGLTVGDVTHDTYKGKIFKVVEEGTIKVLSEKQEDEFEYTKYYVNNASIPPFDLNSLVRSIFSQSKIDYLHDPYDLFNEEIKADDKVEAIMKSPYYKKVLMYEYKISDDSFMDTLKGFFGADLSQKDPRVIKILRNGKRWDGDPKLNSLAGKMIKEREDALGRKLSPEREKEVYNKFLTKTDKVYSLTRVLGKNEKETKPKMDGSGFAKNVVYSDEQLKTMSVTNLEKIIQAGYDASYVVEPLCERYGKDTVSECGFEAKKEKKRLLFPVGHKQVYRLSKDPELKTVEGEEEHEIEPSVMSHKDAIAFYKENILEYLDTGFFGSSGGGSYDMVRVARGEEHNVGGLKYRNWFYGSPTEAAWCAIFISWVANELDFIDMGIIPKSASVSEYKRWFENPNNPGSYHPNDGSYIPKPGDLAIISWEGTGLDHIEIVSEVNGNDIRSIGGNTLSPQIRTTPPGVVYEHDMNMNQFIVGYASPAYPEEDPGLDVMFDIVSRKKHYGYDSMTKRGGLLGWKGSDLSALFNEIEGSNSESFNSIISRENDAHVAKFKQERNTGEFNSTEGAMIANKILNSKAGKDYQDKKVKDLIRSATSALDKYGLNGKPLAYAVEMVLDFQANGQNALQVRAIDSALEKNQDLKRLHNSIKGLSPFASFKVNREDSYRYINSMDDSRFMFEIGGEVVEAQYLRGLNKEAILCPLDGRATTMKTYMSYRAITAKNTRQWKLQNNTIQGHKATTDPKTGVRKFNGRYMVAMAPTYGPVGTRLDITIGNKVVKVIVGDLKSEGATCQHYDGSFIEFIVDPNSVPANAKKNNFNVLPEFSGAITKVVYRGTISIPD